MQGLPFTNREEKRAEKTHLERRKTKAAEVKDKKDENVIRTAFYGTAPTLSLVPPVVVSHKMLLCL